jgi:2Fe-2S ferredoxin
MAKVKIVNDDIILDIPDGEMLYRYAKDNCGIMFGCLKGECGICMCTVLRGEENLNKRTHKEHMILENRGATSAQRLACQVVVNQGEVEIEY